MAIANMDIDRITYKLQFFESLAKGGQILFVDFR